VTVFLFGRVGKNVLTVYRYVVKLITAERQIAAKKKEKRKKIVDNNHNCARLLE
jgi:hypothetical protein